MNRRFAIALFCVGFVIIMLTGYLINIGGVPIKTVRTEKGTARIVFTLNNLFHVHEDPKKELKIDGKTYQRLRGEPPYYLEVPALNSVLFVTDEKEYPYKVTFHILNLDT